VAILLRRLFFITVRVIKYGEFNGLLAYFVDLRLQELRISKHQPAILHILIHYDCKVHCPSLPLIVSLIPELSNMHLLDLASQSKILVYEILLDCSVKMANIDSPISGKGNQKLTTTGKIFFLLVSLIVIED
jgi:hypothetical protein